MLDALHVFFESKGTIMRRATLMALTVAAIAVFSTEARAQRPRSGGFGGGFGSPLFLLSVESVQKELKLTPEQTTGAEAICEKQRESFGGFRDLTQEERRAKFEEMTKASDEAIDKLLDADQRKRLDQIFLQVRGSRAFEDPKVSAALKLTDLQKDEIETIQQDALAEFEALRAEGFGDEQRKKFEAIRESTKTKALEVLTDEQRKTWTEMIGEPFTGELRFGPPGGRRRGENRPAAAE